MTRTAAGGILHAEQGTARGCAQPALLTPAPPWVVASAIGVHRLSVGDGCRTPSAQIQRDLISRQCGNRAPPAHPVWFQKTRIMNFEIWRLSADKAADQVFARLSSGGVPCSKHTRAACGGSAVRDSALQVRWHGGN